MNCHLYSYEMIKEREKKKKNLSGEQTKDHEVITAKANQPLNETTATEYYCHPCILECNGQLPKIGKWDSTLCLTCGDTLLDEGIWKNIPRREEACDKTCQYTILINDWVRKGTPIDNAWKRALRHLEEYPHDEDEI
ncbi:hypothetical protein G9A89_018096 [Geosiphon pyriformis]|nr:hypothetical protein G9A89_018096 [Geosiphon pyriformis]